MYVPYRWAELVDSGELARTLTRLCQHVGGLTYRLVRHGGALTLELPSATLDLTAYDDVNEALEAILAAIDPALKLVRDRGDWQIVRSGAAEADTTTLPKVQGEDGSLLGLVAAYIERLARFAGMTDVFCEPRWAQDDGVMTFTLSQRPASGGGLQTTLRVPMGPFDAQPILDGLNELLRGAESRRLYRAARDPARVDVVFLDKAGAAELRRRGELIEDPARDVVSALANSGFELSAMYGSWRSAGYEVRKLAAKLRVLAGDRFELSGEVDDDGEGSIAVRWRIAGTDRVTRIGREHAEARATAVMPLVIADLNRGLGEAGLAWRAVIATGVPHFYGQRAFLLEPAWVAALARSRALVAGCLDDATRAGLVTELGAYPPRELTGDVPRIPEMEELVKRDSIQGNDFKCSARPSDMVDLIEGIARFARVAVEVGEVRDVGGLFEFDVTYRNERSVIVLENEKYVSVAPVLEFLNPLLAARSPRVQLYYFRSGAWDGGLVRATDDEAAQLRAAGYIS